jgi:hypothetical protein
MLLTLAQSAIGVFMALLIVVSFVRLLPEPGTKTPFEQAPPPYDPEAQMDDCASRRSFWMSKISSEALALAAAIGAFFMAALSLLLGYGLLSAVATPTGRVAPVQCGVGVCLVSFGVVATLFAAAWLGVTSLRRQSSDRQE